MTGDATVASRMDVQAQVAPARSAVLTIARRLAACIALTAVFLGSGRVLAEEVLRCSPPALRDISLTLAIAVEGGGEPVSGSSGFLEFTVRNLQGSGEPVPAAVSHYPDHGFAMGDRQPLFLHADGPDACVMTQHLEPVGGAWRLFYTALVPGVPPGGTGSCRLRFVVAEAAPPTYIEWSATPWGLCYADPNPADNRAGFAFGDFAGTPAPVGVTVRGQGAFGWTAWTALLLAMLAAPVWLRR